MEWVSSSESDFGFAFNNRNFSDKVLQIEIMADPVDVPPTANTATTIADGKKTQSEKGDEAGNSHDSNWTMDGSAATAIRVKALYINSALLAAKSHFFYNLFSNGMRETAQTHVTLRINASEEDALMELLNFMYRNTLNISAAPAVFDVLIAADKFDVSSCTRYSSSWLLQNSPMTLNSALYYLEQLPYTNAVQPLTDAAKQYLAGRYTDIIKFHDEVMALPLYGIEAILASDDLQVDSEDVVYDFVLKWVRQNYNSQEEKLEVLGSRLARLIRFPYMTCPKLKNVLTCNDLKHECTFQLVVEALIFKAKAPQLQRQQAEESASLIHRRFVERAYKYRPIRVVKYELPLQQCVVYLDLKREECATLFPSGGRVYSQKFHLGGQAFFLSAECNMYPRGVALEGYFHCFGLFLGMQENGSVSLAVDYEFAAWTRPTLEFFVRYKDNYTFTGGEVVGHKNLFEIPWKYFIGENSRFFINDILHLRAVLTIKH